MNPPALTARSVTASPASPLAEFMIMAGGLQTINCGQGSKDVTVTVQVDRSTAAALEQQRVALSAKSAHRPYFDFDHDDKSASFWPSQFLWSDSPAPGVYARGEWTAAGRAAIEGKTYRAFSPKFHVDSIRAKPAKVICYEAASLNMGGLVNDPAFKNNLPLWAKSTETKNKIAATPQIKTTMTPAEVAALQARILQLKQDITSLTANSTGSAEDAEAIQAKQRELVESERAAETEELRAKNITLEQQLYSQREKDADAAVKAAVKRGAIPTKDDALQAAWKKKCIEDVDNIALLAKIASAPALNASRHDQPVRLSLGNIAITRASNADVLGKMQSVCARQGAIEGRGDSVLAAKQAPAKELAELYAKEIMPRLREGDDIPLEGANSLGTLSQTLVAIQTLELLQLSFPLLKMIMTDFSDQIVSYGDTLKSRFVGIPTVRTYNTTTGWPTDSDVTTTDVSITYDQYKGIPIKFQGHEVSATIRRLFDEIAPAQAYALGKDIVDYIYSLITAAYTNTVTAAGLGTFGRSTIIDIGGILDDAGVPEQGRFLLLNRPYYSALSKDNTIIQMAAFQRASLIEKGLEPETLSQVEGLRVIKAVNLPATVISGATVLKGFAGSKSALALATRLSADYINANPGAGNGTLDVVTTPGGFSANLVRYVNHGTAAAYQRMEIIYGASRAQVAAGALLTDV